MCIAIIKPGSAPLPTLEQLQNCAKTNRDGGGLCYPTASGKVQIYKGFKDAESMFAFLQTQDFSSVPMMIHFRIGTHGDKGAPKHTHPFPVGKGQEEMEKLSYLTDMALMHNGIMYKFGYDKEISDTMAFARDCLPGLLQLPEVCRGIVLSEVLGTSNKIALMNSDGEISKVGTWIEDGGLFWSNTSYKSFTYSADPRNWGPAAGCVTGGKYKNRKSSAQTAFQDDDFDQSWRDPFGKNLKRPTGAQFWSEVIENDPINFDVDALRDDYFAITRVLGRQVPYGTDKPTALTNKEWDTVVSWRYTYNYVKDDEWDTYIFDKRVLPGELEVEMAVTEAIETAAVESQAPDATLPMMGDQHFVATE